MKRSTRLGLRLAACAGVLGIAAGAQVLASSPISAAPVSSHPSVQRHDPLPYGATTPAPPPTLLGLNQLGERAVPTPGATSGSL